MCLLLISAAVFSFTLFAQNTSGSITGVVEDTSGGVVAGAQATLINQDRSITARQTLTNEAGVYLFSAVPPAVYTLVLERPGFKSYRKTGIKLFVNDAVGLTPIVLEVGSQAETISVETNPLGTVSAERAGVITSMQLLDIALNGRDVGRLVKTIPGAPADANAAATTFNGLRGNQNNFTVDGVTFIDSGANAPLAFRISLEAIAEVKTSTTGLTAEFGRNSGAQIQMATRSGGQSFHGGWYYFKRHESWNANTFTNNRHRRSAIHS